MSFRFSTVSSSKFEFEMITLVFVEYITFPPCLLMFMNFELSMFPLPLYQKTVSPSRPALLSSKVQLDIRPLLSPHVMMAPPSYRA